MRINVTEPERLSNLLRERYAREDIPPLTGISTDSREVRPGDLFIAIAGSRVDSHGLAGDAVAAGALAVLAEREIDGLPDNIPVLQTDGTIRELGAIAKAWRRIFTQPLIAITGSNGKTTTKNLILQVLGGKYDLLGTTGTFNSRIGLPMTLLQLSETAKVIIVELGSNQPGEIAYLADIAQPVIGLVTNVNETHVAFLKDSAGVAQEKAALFKALPLSGTAIVNLDDPTVSAMETEAERLTYGLVNDGEHEPDIVGGYDTSDNHGFLLIGADMRIRLPNPGRHMAQNALAAVAVGILYGLPMNDIKDAIEGFALSPGRGEVFQREGVTVINDTYNANLASAQAGLDTMADFEIGGRRIAVLGDMLELGVLSSDHHRLLGEYVAGKGVDELFCYGPESRITCESARAAGTAARHFDDKTALGQALAQAMAAGDLIYFKGSRGMAMETVIKELFGEESC